MTRWQVARDDLHMRILFDQGTPVPLRDDLSEHEVSTAFEMGWSSLTNGELLRRAEATFDVLVTTDQSLPHQQNLARLQIAVVVLPTTSWPLLRAASGRIATAIGAAKPGELVQVSLFD